jgi:cytochrome c oxidase subunit 1
MSAEPDVREPSAEPSPWPLIAALALTVMVVGSIFSPWAVLFGAIPVSIALIAWFWPKSPTPHPEPTIA